MKWAIIENAGYEGERNIGGEFGSSKEAWAYVSKMYDPDEQESLHVDVAHWDEDGEFWSYDH
jgi:hypothetical protein